MTVNLLEIPSRHPVRIDGTAETQKIIKNLAGGTIYYDETREVSASVNNGSLLTGNSISLRNPTWLIASVNTHASEEIESFDESVPNVREVNEDLTITSDDDIILIVPGQEGENEEQLVQLFGVDVEPTGTFTLDFDGQVTASIDAEEVITAGPVWNSEPVEEALLALSNVAPGDITVNVNGPLLLITFGGAFEFMNVPQIVPDNTGMEPEHEFVLSTNTNGAAEFEGEEEIILTIPIGSEISLGKEIKIFKTVNLGTVLLKGSDGLSVVNYGVFDSEASLSVGWDASLSLRRVGENLWYINELTSVNG